MKIRKVWMLALLGIFSLLSNGYAQEPLNREEVAEPPFEKVYLYPDRVFLDKDGPFYLNGEDRTRLRSISSDSTGLYIMAGIYKQQPLNREEVAEPPVEKIYVSPDRILIATKGRLFCFNEAGNMIPVRSISSDETGLYIVAGMQAYQCPRCGHWNENEGYEDSKDCCINVKCPLFGH